MVDDPILYADRDQVIEYTKEWLDLWQVFVKIMRDAEVHQHTMEQWQKDQYSDAQDIIGPVVSLAYNRAKEALTAYAKHRETLFTKHDEMLDTIEELLQEKVKDIKDGGEKN